MPTNYTFRVLFHMDRSKRNASQWKKIEAKAEEILSAGGRIRKLSGERWRGLVADGHRQVIRRVFWNEWISLRVRLQQEAKGSQVQAHRGGRDAHHVAKRVRRIPGRDRSGRGGDQVPNRDPCGQFISI